MIPDNQFDNLLDAAKAASEQGFTHHFSVKEKKLFCEETGETFSAEELKIESFNRVEGSSDPDDSAILYLIETKSGIKGTLTDAYGVYADPGISEFLKNIPIDRSETGARFESKVCLNCGAPLNGKYCHQCGQKDEHLHEPAWKLFSHAIADEFHFDSKFFHTIGPLFYRPAFLTKEFLAGRRVRYVHPVRLYFFTTIVFFILFFSFIDPRVEQTHFAAKRSLAEVLQDSSSTKDSSAQRIFGRLKNKLGEDSAMKAAATMFDALDSVKGDSDLHVGISFGKSDYIPNTIKEYEDSIKKMPADQRPGVVNQFFTRIAINLKGKDPGEVMKSALQSFIHGLPHLMFFLIPVFALILKLLYVRRKIYLVDHAVFTLHFHVFVFMLFIIGLIINLMGGAGVNFGWVLLVMMLYLFLAMRNFYRQSYIKTALKLFGLLFLYTISAVFILGIGFSIELVKEGM